MVALTAGNTVGNVGKVFAATTEYSNVLDDLTKDESFDYNEYPENSDDYSLTLFQIAESNGGELFIYVYQPAEGNRGSIATSINISLTEEDPKFINYKLQFLNYEGTLFKYKVKDLACDPSAELRLYNISAIYRKYINGVDEDTGNDNEINEVAFNVGKLFQARTNEDGETVYVSQIEETIQITDFYVDFLQYSEGFHLMPTWCRSYYIAFDTDKLIQQLLEADVSFIWRHVNEQHYFGTTYLYDEDNVVPCLTLTGTQKGSNLADGFLSKKYEWNRIQSIDEFIKTEDLKSSTLKELENKKWVLRFYESEISTQIGMDGYTAYLYNEVRDVTILRLKFITNAKLYNLGAVANKQTGDNIPGNNNVNEYATLWEYLARITGLPEWFWKLIIFGVPILLFITVLSIIFPPVWAVVKAIFKGIFFIISLPFKGIKKLAELHRKRKEEKQRESAQSNQADDRPPARKKSKTKSNKKRGKKK